MQELLKPCQEILSSEQVEWLKKTLLDHLDVFAQHENDLGRTSLIQQQINTGNNAPIKQASRRVPLAKCEAMESLIEAMKGPGIIEPSSSLWSSLVTLVPKKEGTTRFCVDYQKLNKVTRKDSYPLPRMDDIFDVLHGDK